MVYGTWFMAHGSCIMVSFIIFFSNLVDLPVYFPLMSTLTLVTIETLSGTWGFYLNHVLPLKPFKTVLDNVLLKHVGLPWLLPWPPWLWDTVLTLRGTFGFYLNHLIPLRLDHGGLPQVLPLAVHLILLPEQVEVVILSHFYSFRPPSCLKVMGEWGGGGGGP